MGCRESGELRAKIGEKGQVLLGEEKRGRGRSLGKEGTNENTKNKPSGKVCGNQVKKLNLIRSSPVKMSRRGIKLGEGVREQASKVLMETEDVTPRN